MALSDFLKTLILATVPAIVGGGVIVGGIEYLSKDREHDIKMVEIGLSILRSDPRAEGQINPAREWAIRLVETHSGQDFNDDDKRKLLVYPLKIAELDIAKEIITKPSSILQLSSFDVYAKNNSQAISKELPIGCDKALDDRCLSMQEVLGSIDFAKLKQALDSINFQNLQKLEVIEETVD